MNLSNLMNCLEVACWFVATVTAMFLLPLGAELVKRWIRWRVAKWMRNKL